MTALQNDDRRVLDLIVPQLEAAGYTVYFHPPHQFLPVFMEGYTPDAIAIPADNAPASTKKLAIEVARDGRSRAEGALERRFAGVDDWELRVLYARPEQEESDLPRMSIASIDAAFASIEALASSDQSQAALLLGWAIFEALGRLLAPGQLDRAQTPERLLETLAGDGFVTPSEADRLRDLSRVRNQLIHGAVDRSVSRADLLAFIGILRTLRGLLDPGISRR